MSKAGLRSTEQKLWAGQTLLADVALSAFAGCLITFLMFGQFWASEVSLGALGFFYRILVSPSDDYEAGMRIVLVIPLVVTVTSVLVTRNIVERTTSRSEWNRALSILVLTTILIGLIWVCSTFLIARLIPFRDLYSLGHLLLISIVVAVGGLILGWLVGRIFHAQKRIFKILTGAITSGLVAALFELGTIFAMALYYR